MPTAKSTPNGTLYLVEAEIISRSQTFKFAARPTLLT
jgi:hypothetical protein